MKKFISILLLLLFLFPLCSCSNDTENKASNMDHTITNEILEINNVNNLSDETIKALSVIIRTQKNNNTNNTDNVDKNINNENNTNISFDKENPSINNDTVNNEELKDKILNLVKQTNKETILIDNNKNINYVDNLENYQWKKNIKKSDILNFLSKNNISLNNVSNFEPYFTDDNKLSHIKVGGKNISYDELKSNFNLNSSTITKIDNNFSSITIYGNGFDDEIFDINNANNLSKNNYNYEQLLKHFFNDFTFKTI